MLHTITVNSGITFVSHCRVVETLDSHQLTGLFVVEGKKDTEPKKRRTPKSGVKKCRKNSKSSSDDSDDSYETCSAKSCSHPVGRC